MEEEIYSIEKNWVKAMEEEIASIKARLVAKGYLQQPGRFR